MLFLTEPLFVRTLKHCIRIKTKNTSADNTLLQVDKGVIASIQHYDNNSKRGYGFSLDKIRKQETS